ncbi:18859_t:CDS:2 [Acaulospora morrowiae]|uniref:18859_t:CDS:1 n=1 Tax=Acaulospora morrowiae TaxID=94023 RepID=A0A9N8ZTV5_9GLOM|nr:18859_t:CDS:2 [Acaulospora morrowiae]
MANNSKPSRIVNPFALAGNFSPNQTLNRLLKFLNSVPGTDKVLMFVQYFSKIIIWFLSRVGKESLAGRIANISSPVGDFRILLRYYGLLSLVQWMIHIEHHPPATSLLLNIERIQNLTMVLYYPLEHIYWLAAHKNWNLELSFLGGLRTTSILASRSGMEVAQEKTARYDQKIERIWRESIINVGYLPLTVHWSIENSSFPDVGVGIFGTIAAFYQLRGAWKGTTE